MRPKFKVDTLKYDSGLEVLIKSHRKNVIKPITITNMGGSTSSLPTKQKFFLFLNFNNEEICFILKNFTKLLLSKANSAVNENSSYVTSTKFQLIFYYVCD